MEVFVRAGRLDCTKSIVEILKEGAETDTPPEAGAAGKGRSTIYCDLCGYCHWYL